MYFVQQNLDPYHIGNVRKEEEKYEHSLWKHTATGEKCF